MVDESAKETKQQAASFSCAVKQSTVGMKSCGAVYQLANHSASYRSVSCNYHCSHMTSVARHRPSCRGQRVRNQDVILAPISSKQQEQMAWPPRYPHITQAILVSWPRHSDRPKILDQIQGCSAMNSDSKWLELDRGRWQYDPRVPRMTHRVKDRALGGGLVLARLDFSVEETIVNTTGSKSRVLGCLL